MSLDATKADAILSKWRDEHLEAEHRHRVLRKRGAASLHAYAAEAHARAALALQREVEGGGCDMPRKAKVFDVETAHGWRKLVDADQYATLWERLETFMTRELP